MIFHFEFSAEQLISVDRNLLQTVLAEAARASRLGHHIIILDRTVADFALGQLELSSIERSAIERLRSEFTQTADLLRRAPFHIKITDLPAGTFRTVGSAHEISLDRVDQTALFDKTVIVVEDEATDGALYEFVFKNLRDILKIPPIHCDWTHGGGERTIDIARSRIDSRRIVCVIVDSDNASPKAIVTKKHSDMQSLGADPAWPPVFGKVTPCREAENLISLEIVAMLDCSQQRANELDCLRRIVDAETKAGTGGANAFWMFFDVKDGCARSKADKLADDEKKWILQKVAYAMDATSDFAIEGFGAHVVAQLMRTSAARAKLRSDIRTRDWLDMFESFISTFMWAAVGSARIYT